MTRSLQLTQFITFILEAIYNNLLMMKSFHASWTLQPMQKPSFDQGGLSPDSVTFSSHYANNWLHVTHTKDMTFPEHKIQIEIFKCETPLLLRRCGAGKANTWGFLNKSRKSPLGSQGPLAAAAVWTVCWYYIARRVNLAHFLHYWHRYPR